MNGNRVIALALVITVLLAGCSSIDSLTGSSTPTEAESTATETETATATETSTPTATSTQVVKTPAPTATARPTGTWTEPATPKAPEDKNDNRIKSAKIINKKKASDGNGYTDFDVQVNANTLFDNIDPTPSVDGEPYIVVEINGEIVARDEVNLRKDGSFTIDVRPGALEQFDSGTLKVSATLYDEDHKHDDIYGTWSGTVEYTSS
ncbi:hypothetical protein [Halocatena marina]|uniref:Lipoprotein n=1 Tax=Halocatena marina TaxID=2934937 RepID=A0ABD5YM33_9EURY|nr:hypothetical protein [Halocatena marina]